MSATFKKALLAIVFGVAAAGTISSQPVQAKPASPIAPDQQRGVEQTFLTFPEWFLVHSPAEFAAYVAHHPAHGFPFIAHIGQLWSSYGSVIGEQVRKDYPINLGYHVMICVIASSTTLEYAIRSAYENTVGRIGSVFSANRLTDEDRYSAMVAQDYVDFIRREPWYLYGFASKLKMLWTTVPMTGPGLVRKWERRYALTTEYATKAIYAKVIEMATRAAYTPALMTTQVVVEHVPEGLSADRIALVRRLPDGSAVMDMPRYFDFRVAATTLAQHGGNLIDIAGNSSVILVSVWAAADADFHRDDLRALFEQPLITMPGKKRVAVIVPVRSLSRFLLEAPQRGIEVEHVYDY